MTTLVQAALGVIDSPQGGAILPSMGTTGVLARYHAKGISDAVGATPARILDSSGYNRHGTPTGSVTVGSRNGVRTLKMGASGAITSPSFAAPKARTIACMVYVGAVPSSTQSLIDTAPASVYARLALASTNSAIRAALYAGGAAFPSSAAAVTVGWHSIVGVLRTDGTGSVTLDGVTTSGSLDYTTPASTLFSLFHASAQAEYLDAAIINHAVTNTELTAIVAALEAQRPA